MTTTTTTLPVSHRFAWVDRARGLAIVLMVLDHVLVVIDPTSPVRYTLTRLALPLFMFTAAAVHRPLTRRRLLRLAPAVLLEATAALYVLGTAPGIVTTYVAVALLAHHVDLHRHALALTTLGLLQTLYLPLPITGYQPGLVLAWFTLGLLAWPHLLSLFAPAHHLAPLERIGRHPLAWYCGHLLALVPLAYAI